MNVTYNNRYLLALVVFFGLTCSQVAAQTLEDYLQIAAENNPDLKAVYAEFEAALQEAPQVSSLPDPNLTVSAFGRMVETRLGPQEARFSLMQMFPWFGTLEARENAANLAAEAKFQSFLDARNELFYQVSEKYFQLYELERGIRFQRDNAEILRNYKDLSLSRVRAGSGALSDVLQTELMINETATALEILDLQKAPLRTQFNSLLNRHRNMEVVLPEQLETTEVSLQEIPDGILEDHPKLMEMEKMAASARSREVVARKEGYPDIGLGMEYAIIGKRTDANPEGNGRDAFMPMLSISLPIFRKKYRAAEKEAQFMQESYSQRRVAVKNRLSAEFEAAIFDLERSRSMLALYEKQVESSNQVLNLLLSSYRNAAADFEEVLRVRQELLRYQLEIAGAEAAFFTAIARINYLSGKAF